MVQFEAHCDVSGDPSSTPIFTMAALVATKQRWERFNVAWERAMARGGAAGKILHMRELIPGNGQFAGWEDEEKQFLLRKLFPQILPHVTLLVCPSVSVDAFAKHIRLTEAKKAEQLNEWNVCLQVCMEQIEENVTPSAERPVTFFSEEDPAHDPDLLRQFYHLRGLRKGWADCFPPMVFKPKGPPPLQAADMIAYSANTYFADELAGRLGTQSVMRRFLRTMLIRLASSRTENIPRRCAIGMFSEDLLRKHGARLTHEGRQINADPVLRRAIVTCFDAAHDRMQKQRDKDAREKRGRR